MRPLAPIAFALALTLTSPLPPHRPARRRRRPTTTGTCASSSRASPCSGPTRAAPRRRSSTCPSCPATVSGRMPAAAPSSCSPTRPCVRLDRRSKLDYSGHEEERDERIVLRLWSGSLLLRGRERRAAHFEVETPGGTVLPREQSLVRVDVDAGEARVSVYEGEALLDDGRSRVPLAEGERTYARGGESAADPTRFDRNEQDDFAQWDQDRESEARWASGSGQLPEELEAYEGELEGNGDWRYEASVGNVWVPQVQVGWTPYSNGHWSWTAYGWTWIPYERWGWAPHHYGSWGHSASFGWYWVPGRTWGPAWVNWAVGGGYVGWCPTGPHGRAAVGWGHHGGGFGNSAGNHCGHAVPRRTLRPRARTGMERRAQWPARSPRQPRERPPARRPHRPGIAACRRERSPASHSRRSAAGRRPRRAARGFDPAAAGRLRARALGRQQDDRPRSVDARLRTAARRRRGRPLRHGAGARGGASRERGPRRIRRDGLCRPGGRQHRRDWQPTRHGPHPIGAVVQADRGKPCRRQRDDHAGHGRRRRRAGCRSLRRSPAPCAGTIDRRRAVGRWRVGRRRGCASARGRSLAAVLAAGPSRRGGAGSHERR